MSNLTEIGNLCMLFGFQANKIVNLSTFWFQIKKKGISYPDASR